MDEVFYLDQTLYEGRPENQREAVEDRCYDFLETNNVCFQRCDHDIAMTIPVCHEVEQVLKAPICKNLFLCNRQKTMFYLLLMQGDKVFKTKYLSAQLGCARLSFGDEEDMHNFLEVKPGSTSVLGLMNDQENRVQLVIDKPLLKEKYFGCHPCKNTSTLRFTTDDLMNKVIPALHHEPIFVDLPEEEQ